MMKKKVLASVIAGTLALTGCKGDWVDKDNVDQSAAPSVSSIPVSSVTFNPSAGELSTPTDLLMSSTTGLINIPKTGDIYESLNSLDGWGIGSPIAIGVTFPSKKYGAVSLDTASVESANSVVLFDATAGKQLTYGVDYIVKGNSSGLNIIPLKAFKPANQYLIGITDAVVDSLGRKLTASTMYNLLSNSATDVTTLTADATQQAQLAGIKALLTGINPVLSNFKAADSNLIYSTRFTTQSVEKVMQKVMAQIVTANPSVNNVATAQQALGAKGVTLADSKLSSFLTGIGQGAVAASATVNHDPLVYFGNLTVPYFLDLPTAANCGVALATTGTCDALTSHWKASDDGVLRPADNSPKKQSDQNLQVFISLPDENKVTKPAAGWPVALYVHGITSYKETAVAIAGNLAAQGIALVAIDLPLHGSRSIDLNADGVYELTTTDKSSGAAYANGSPLVFANLGALRTVRDNLRQSASDLLALRAALNNAVTTIGGGSTLSLDGNTVSLLGVSLGSIIGTTVLGSSDRYDANNDGTPEIDSANPFDFNAAVLTVGGSQAAAVMGYSNSFGPIVKSALKKSDAFAAGVASNLGYTPTEFITLRTTDPTAFDSLANVAYPNFAAAFVAGAQQVVDGGDALAWAGKVNSDTPVLVTQVVGNGVNLADQTVPNSTTANGFPLGGTMGLINALSLTQASSSTASASGLKVYTNFSVGKHTSLLDPSESAGVTQDAASALAATTEMQTQAISFIKSAGKQVAITNSNVVQ